MYGGYQSQSICYVKTISLYLWILVRQFYDPSKHNGQDRYFGSWEGIEKVDDQMQRLLNWVGCPSSFVPHQTETTKG